MIAFGPFYHLVSDSERRQTATEIRRVLATHGQAFISFVPRLSGLIGLIGRAAPKPAQVPAEALEMAADTGVFSNAVQSGFQEGYYPWPSEIEQLFASSGFRVTDLSPPGLKGTTSTRISRRRHPCRADEVRVAQIAK